jgi:DNA-binding response OmpR family regulator
MAAENNPSSTILVVTSNRALSEFLQTHLAGDGYRLLTTSDEETAIRLAERHPLLIMVDHQPPRHMSLDLCRHIRNNPQTATLPILLLSTSDDAAEAILGLEVGADDYIIHPFQWGMLRARMRALLRRSTYQHHQTETPEHVEKEECQIVVPQWLVVGDLSLDLAGRTVMRGKEPLELSARLFELLVYLVQHPGVTHSRLQLMKLIQGENMTGSERLLDVYIHWLREKIEEDPARPKRIQTVRGAGYRFVSDENEKR